MMGVLARRLLPVVLSANAILTAQEPIRYTVRIPQPDSHYAEVTLDAPASGPRLLFQTAVWTPYVTREYARNVEDLRAEGKAAVTKVTKNRWQVETGGAARVRLHYRVYCRAMHVQDCFIDDEFALLNGAPLFLTLEHHRRPHEVRFELPAGWQKSVTQMAGAGAPHHYIAPDYDTLMDSPVILGNPSIHTTVVAGKRIHLVNVGDASQWNGEKAVADLARIAEAQSRIWGGFPCEDYYFLNVLSGRGGGMEHRCSTVTMTRPDAAQNPRRYRAWLELLSHEMFHLWNVKRLRPAEITPGEFETEVYPRTLGIAEGFTSYYGPLAVYRAGLMTQKEWLNNLSQQIHELESTPGRRAQTLAMSSFDTWIKFYRPDENSRNTSISYYTKGAVVAFLLDARIRTMTSGRRRLDDAMRRALERNPEERGYTLDSFREAAEEVAGGSLREWFRKHFESTEELDYREALAWFGLEMEYRGGEGSWLGIEMEPRGTRVAVRRVDRDSPAARAGLSVDDELVSLNGTPLTPANAADRLASLQPGARASFELLRRGRRIQRDVLAALAPPVAFQLVVDGRAGGQPARRRESW
jgi:predicted metalloprotease with PDZ domain